MANPDLELVDLLPIRSSYPNSAISQALLEHGIGELISSQVHESHEALLEKIISDEGLGATARAVEEALKASVTYKKWQRLMPYLRDVPQIRAYRMEETENDLSGVNLEVLCNGGFLQAGQILFCGGIFVSEQVVISNGPMSTTMHPSVARWHAKMVNGQIAILKIAASHSVLGFVYRVTGNQKFKHEYEVLLQNNLRLVQTSICCVGEFQVRSYDVHPCTA
ncbi:hypothetical protein [Synechococcus sp. FACHB-909]|uniref:hypothetical protein n=1 Tax=Synechococcus sp. FACHB-909 TaxID=2692863 RepID=UPI001687FF35|nr:hypothetical protein [Synechococcus sp. FACHB-909]MBD2719322.1 hypothetical protein [Synechococcus sp. FACHB-909]